MDFKTFETLYELRAFVSERCALAVRRADCELVKIEYDPDTREYFEIPTD